MTANHELYSVDEVARRLGLHVRTVRNYVRDGRLKAVRIGKQYRIAREHLDALTGHVATASPVAIGAGPRHVDVSSIVEIDAIDADTASRLTNGLLGGAKGRPDHSDPLRINTIYEPERARLKVILTGSIATTTELMKLIGVYLES